MYNANIYKDIQSNYQVYRYSFVHIVFWANQYFHWETSEPDTSVQDSRKLPSYPSHKPTFTPTSNLRQIVGLGGGGGGVGGHFPEPCTNQPIKNQPLAF